MAWSRAAQRHAVEAIRRHTAEVVAPTVHWEPVPTQTQRDALADELFVMAQRYRGRSATTWQDAIRDRAAARALEDAAVEIKLGRPIR